MVWLYWSLSRLPRQESSAGPWVSKGSLRSRSWTGPLVPQRAFQGPRCGLKFAVSRGLEAQVTSNHPMFLPPSKIILRVLVIPPCCFLISYSLSLLYLSISRHTLACQWMMQNFSTRGLHVQTMPDHSPSIYEWRHVDSRGKISMGACDTWNAKIGNLFVKL
jgi:hypothetical protein